MIRVTNLGGGWVVDEFAQDMRQRFTGTATKIAKSFDAERLGPAAK